MNRTFFSAIFILRIGIAGTFLGHGIYALGIKASFIPLITAFGFSYHTAENLLPVIGILDIIVAGFALFFPIKLILIYATFWAFATALSRVVAGMPVWEFVERASNWAAPLTLLFLHGMPKKLKDLFLVG